jgi:hypothetical protein
VFDRSTQLPFDVAFGNGLAKLFKNGARRRQILLDVFAAMRQRRIESAAPGNRAPASSQ